jgi:Zn-dependent alcohol dehydrogenase
LREQEALTHSVMQLYLGRETRVTSLTTTTQQLRLVPKVLTINNLYLQGRLNLGLCVSETISLKRMEELFHKMERGQVLRSMVVS